MHLQTDVHQDKPHKRLVRRIAIKVLREEFNKKLLRISADSLEELGGRSEERALVRVLPSKMSGNLYAY